MAYQSPLMPFLSAPIIDQRSQGRLKKAKKRIVLGFIAAIFPVMGTSFASSVTMSNGPIEFGQGTQVVVVCDTSITIQVNSAWDSTLGYFKLSALVLGDLDTTSAHCLGKDLRITAYNTSGTVIDINGTDAGNSIIYTVSGTQGASETRSVSVGTVANPVSVDSTTIGEISVETS